MEYKITRELSITLNEEEVFWLKAIIQNPLLNTQDMEEDPNDAKIRRKLWNILSIID